MRCHATSIALAIVLLTTALPSAVGRAPATASELPNGLPNSSFEEGDSFPSGWHLYQNGDLPPGVVIGPYANDMVTWDDSVARTGTHSMLIDFGSAESPLGNQGRPLISDVFAVPPYFTANFLLHVRGHTPYWGPGVGFYYGLQLYGADMNPLATLSVSQWGGTSDQWSTTEWAYSFWNESQRASYARFFIQPWLLNQDYGRYWLDDLSMSISELPPPPSEADLAVVDIVPFINGEAVDVLCEGDPVDFTASIQNNGTAASGDFAIEWVVNGDTYHGSHSSIAAGETGEHGHFWSDIPAGEHTIQFSVSSPDDSNPQNDSYTEAFTVEECGGEVLHYFALGDSIASGHGLLDDGEPCLRSTSSQAYPQVVVSELQQQGYEVSDHFRHLACSGATATRPSGVELKQSEYAWLNNQVQDALSEIGPIPDNEPVVVSITIGANDFYFSDLGNAFAKLYWEPNDRKFEKWADRVAENVEAQVEKYITELLKHPNVSVILTEVHNPFSEDSKYFVSPRKAYCADVACYARTEYAVHRLNRSLVETWVDLGRPERMQITAIHAGFHRHESAQPACGNGGPTIDETWIQLLDCVHPNATGAQYYAEQVLADAGRLGY